MSKSRIAGSETGLLSYMQMSIVLSLKLRDLTLYGLLSVECWLGTHDLPAGLDTSRTSAVFVGHKREPMVESAHR